MEVIYVCNSEVQSTRSDGSAGVSAVHQCSRGQFSGCDTSNSCTPQAKGTNWKNRHPIVTLHLLKMAELNGCGSTLHESYDIAETVCKIIAGNDDLRAVVLDSGQLPEEMKVYLE